MVDLKVHHRYSPKQFLYLNYAAAASEVSTRQWRYDFPYTCKHLSWFESKSIPKAGILCKVLCQSFNGAYTYISDISF
jgi:hypothetical protein